MGTVIKILQLVAALFPIIKILVEAMETPGASGSQKKQAVMDGITAALNGVVANGIPMPLPVSVITGIVGFVVDAVVTGYNLVGIFTKKSVPPVVTTTTAVTVETK